MAEKSPGEEFADRLARQEEKDLENYALKCKARKAELGQRFREYSNTKLEYRTEYQRDRDRIIWSKSFKRLQHKTQIFPAYSTDHFRRRLTHVLEVSQVATTIARALRINEDATEAMALAHDIGHAPFGHAGEIALEEALQQALEGKNHSNKEPARQLGESAVPVFSFNHALQGIETVERIEEEYEPRYPGLNLTWDVREGILKHRRFSGDDELTIRTLGNVLAFSQYEGFGKGPGTLEAQCVLVADKLTYFFEDFEDALRSHILAGADITGDFDEFGKKLGSSVKRFREIEFPKVTDIDSFLAFRRSGLAAFILNAILRAEDMIEKFGTKTLEDVRAAEERIVALEPEVEQAKEALYTKYIEDRTFQHELYQTTECKAKRIVKELFDEYYENKSLIPADYREHAHEVYAELVPDEQQRDIVIVRNYLAGMTDLFAIARHKDLFMSGEQILIA